MSEISVLLIDLTFVPDSDGPAIFDTALEAAWPQKDLMMRTISHVIELFSNSQEDG